MLTVRFVLMVMAGIFGALSLLVIGCSERGGEAPAVPAAATVRFEATQFAEMAQVYEENLRLGRATLVTSDSVLDAAHVLFDYTLRAVEMQRLDADVRALTEAMLARMATLLAEEEQRQYIIAPPPYGHARVTAYFGVAQKLLAPETALPASIAPLVEREVALIRAHQGEALSPILGVTEDYSQYTPRGHYTRNEQLARYFQALMWYGRAGFPISGEKAPGVPLTQEEARANALAGVLLSRELERLAIPPAAAGGEGTGMARWRAIYEPTAFMVGKADDLTPPEYAQLSRDIFGPTLPGGWTAQAQADTDRFIAAAIKLRTPRITGAAQVGAAPPVSLRLLGQRFTMDSLVLQRLVQPYVPGRTMPTGLDVMTFLGSPAAEKLLYDQGVFRNTAYSEQMSALRMAFQARDNAGQWETAYDLWLHALRQLVDDPAWTGRFPDGYLGKARPDWWNDPAWMGKQLNAGLGSWAQLRHDTILYVKQSYTPRSAAAPRPSAVVYVEPVPHVYGGLIRLLSSTREELTAQGVFPAELAANYDEFTRLLRALLLISTQETLAPEERDADVEKPTAEDIQRAADVGAVLRRIATLPEPLRSRITGDEDAQSALIADVHTDATANRVLQVGVGRVMTVVVPVPGAETPTEAYGPIFSYYEFSQPSAHRLTDAEWQQRLDAREAPEPFILRRWVK